MRNDALNGGKGAYTDIKRTLVKSQRALCAYCEIRISSGVDDNAIEYAKSMQRVEHFHPKRDVQGNVNWALHWPNLWAVCKGGSENPGADEAVNSRYYLPPLPQNLSCDAYKERQSASGKLDSDPKGWILSPDEVPAFPLLFCFNPDGSLEPNRVACNAFVAATNNYPNTLTLVAKTIEHLNLSCLRLNRGRSIARAQLEKMIEKARKANPHADPQNILQRLARQLFDAGQTAWPEFFSLVRWRLGRPAEDRLREMQFQG
jgi:uncharacterized protein (TIGR02646 family)